MARRLGATPRPAEDSEDVLDPSDPISFHSKSQSYPHLIFCLLFFVIIFVTFHAFGDVASYDAKAEEPRKIKGGGFGAVEDELSVHRTEDGDERMNGFVASEDGYLSSRPECRAKICDAIPILQEVYGKILHRTLHIGPGTCGVVSKLLKEEDVEVWGIQPFDMLEPVHPLCENFVRKGIIRISDPYNPLPYRKKSFSLVLVTDTLDQMKPKDLNQTLTDLASVSSHSIMLVVGNGVQQQSLRGINLRKPHKPLKPRSRIWWQRRLDMVGLREDAEHSKRFEDLQSEKSFKTTANIFHLHAPGSGEDV